MSFRAALTSVIHAASRPYFVLPAAFIAVVASLSPPAIDDASAQGLRMQTRGSSGTSYNRPNRYPSGTTAKKGTYPTPGRPGGHASTNNYPNRGMGGSASTNNYPNRGMGGSASTNNYPKRGMGGHHPPRPGTTTDTRYPKGDHRHPHWPRRPIYVRPYVPPTVVAIPGGPPPVQPPAPPPPNFSGGQPALPPPPPSNQTPPVNWGRYVPNEVVIEVAANVPPQTINALMQRHGLTQLEMINLQFSGMSIRRMRINGRRTVPAVVQALAAEGFTVQPNLIATLQQQAHAAPALPAAIIEQYALERMRMPEAHSLATGNSVLIAVIDAGADTRHPELEGMILDTYDAIGTGDRVHPHGTSIVGAIVSRIRLRGTAPGAHILVARAFGTNRNSMDGKTTDIIKAIEWAMQRNARVINMSFAGSRDPAIERHLAWARQRGIILVAAAGNAGPTSPPLFPAANPAVIAVTATDENDQIFRGANRGNHIAIAAPGVGLFLPTVGSDYRMTSGTSFSAAEITGVIALMLERNPRLSHEAVRRALMATARDLGAPGIDPQFGAGLVDAYQALMAIMPAVPAANAAPPGPTTANQ
jgi:Subtilase family